MGPIFALACKDLRLLVRDKVGFFFVFGFPLLFGLFFGVIFKGAGSSQGAITILVVDDDQSEASKALIGKLTSAAEVKPIVATYEAALDQVRKGERVAYVRIPKGYGESARRPFWGTPPAFELGVDPARKAEAGMIQGVITQYAVRDVMKIFSDPDALRKQTATAIEEVSKADDLTPVQKGIMTAFFGALDSFMSLTLAPGAAATDGNKEGAEEGASIGIGGWEPVRITVNDVRADRRLSSKPNNPMDITFPQCLVWGLMGCSAAFGISLVVERTRGTLIRLRLAPIVRWHILAGKAAACFLMLLAVSGVMLVFAMVAFGVRPENYGMLAVAILCSAICFVGIMMLLSVCGKTENSAGGIGWSVLLMMAMIGGGMMPLFFMPKWMQSVASISPIKWTVLSLEGAVFRGYSLSDMALPCGVLLGIGVAGFAVGARLFTWQEGSS
ncbi:MAG: ABC transporter permease [Phycisphaerae bacterium]|nr:MAG: ABC transporter permease [Planctomycetota bacterium]MBE7455182.1 ABC transporter permease [Planctomycetia bacterium]MCK6465925.1 ABC transporter permease [Phycisphaerae bacterium]MCL4719663.1 ABC transporter permease [Phycisphaerae bacterium]MCQ3921972.1 ABC transporter permease [Planctomycetota bacterium]